jgi:hypothetical protein
MPWTSSRESIDIDEFYLYVYLDPRKPGSYQFNYYHFEFEPIYIGKGKNYRKNDHIYECRLNNSVNKKKINKIRKILNIGLEPIIKIIDKSSSEAEIFKKEIYLIDLIGRHDENRGSLCNLTNGGDGVSGYKWTEEQRKTFIETRTGKNHPNYGKPRSEETRRKISEANKGKKHTEEHRRKNSEAKKAAMTDNLKIKLSEQAKKAWEDKEYKLYQSDLAKKRWENEDYREKVTTAIRERNKKDEYKKKMKEASMLGHLKRWGYKYESLD